MTDFLPVGVLAIVHSSNYADIAIVDDTLMGRRPRDSGTLAAGCWPANIHVTEIVGRLPGDLAPALPSPPHHWAEPAEYNPGSGERVTPPTAAEVAADLPLPFVQEVSA